jgi:arylsulfatase A-like enzyme
MFSAKLAAPVTAILCALMQGCGGPSAVDGSVLLARHPEALIALELPDATRSSPPPEWIRIRAPLRHSRTVDTIDEYTVRLPFANIHRSHNSDSPPARFGLRTSGKHHWRFRRAMDKPWTWHIRGRFLTLRVPSDAPVPDLSTWTTRYGVAVDTAKSMSAPHSDLAPRDFALRQMTFSGGDRYGLFLPAPSSATFEITLPNDPVLEFHAGLLRPPLDRGVTSDGATLHVEVLRDGIPIRARACALLKTGERTRIRMHLGQYEGQTVQIRFQTDPGETTRLDHVFIEDPAVYTPTWSPKRLVLLFADTLRPDHLGAYGYDRPTSPALDSLADEGTLFEQVRSVSPWTLPAARAALTGRQPEEWHASERLPKILAERGWHTAAFVGNAFLSQEFDMGEDWGLYRYRFLASSENTVDAALGFLGQRAQSDVAVLLHFMDPHLPYTESPQYKNLWAGAAPAGLSEGVSLLELRDLDALEPAVQAAYATYMKARYDQNIRMMDDQVARLLKALPADATVVLYSDHGEEFWEHGGVEHGHALWDEVVKVPLIIRSPGLKTGRISTPASLLDLTPTVLGALGIDIDTPFQGRDLSRDRSVQPLAIGRILRGAESWAVVDGHNKWVTRLGRQHRYDLSTDPTENAGREDPHTSTLAPEAALLSKAVARPVQPVLHVIGAALTDAQWGDPHAQIKVSLPGGFSTAWSRGSLPVQEPVVQGDQVTLGPAVAPFTMLPPEFFAVPVSKTLDGLTLEVRSGDEQWKSVLGEGAPLPLVAGTDKALFEVRWDALPLPPEQAVPGTHPDRTEELRALGYIGD